MSWDEMMRSLSDPVYGYEAQGIPSFPHVSQCTSRIFHFTAESWHTAAVLSLAGLLEPGVP